MRCSSEVMAASGRECHKLSERLRERKTERTQRSDGGWEKET